MTETQTKTPLQHTAEKTVSPDTPDAMTQLLKNIIKPLLIAAVFDTAALATQNAPTLIMTANLALFSVVALQAVYAKKESRERTMIAGIVSGGIIGILLGIVKLAMAKTFWSFFILITTPTLWMVVGGIVTAVVYTVAKKFAKEGNSSKQTQI